MKVPIYIAFEGIDGAGKSTQMSLFADRLRKRDYFPIELAEPTYGKFGRKVREYLSRGDRISIERQIDFFTRDRREHVRLRIRPLLKFIRRHPRFLLLQHRYYLSAPAYQSAEPMAMAALLRQQQAIAPRPDLVLLLDVPASVAIRRLQRKGEKGGHGVFGRRDVLEAVRWRYRALAKEGSEAVVTIDAADDPRHVSDRIWSVFRSQSMKIKRKEER